MTETFDSAATELEFSAAVEAAKLRALYNFAYGLSHEINNPLANIATRAQTLLVDEKDAERRRKLATIAQQAFRAHEMIADLMLFAHPPRMQPQEVDVVRLVNTVVAELQEQAREQGTTLRRTGDPTPLLANVDSTQIGVALKAIVQNALEALEEGGGVEVNAERGAGDAEHNPIPPPHFTISDAAVPCSADPLDRRCPGISHLLLTVTDTGPGIPADVRPHIFDPFFSGREAGRGLGLGLSKAWRIVELHGGKIQVKSKLTSGTTFRIILPHTMQTKDNEGNESGGAT